MSDNVAVYRRVLGHFTELVDSLQPDQLAAPTPCEGWTVRDLMIHVIERDRRLAAMVGGEAPKPLPAEDSLASLWRERVAWWAAGLADPERRDVVWSTPLGELSFEDATCALMTGELLIHTWDLARALGVDETLDPEAVQATLDSMSGHADALRRPGVMGPAIEPPSGSDEQTQLIAFTGRQV